MNYRRFGKTGWNVSEIGYGMWGMAGWTGSDDTESLDSLQRAVDLGCNFFDTAWAYGDGRSEQILGRILRITPTWAEQNFIHRDKSSAKKSQVAQQPADVSRRLLPARIHRGICDKSLANLGLSRST